MNRFPLNDPGTVARCPNHEVSSREFRAVAPVEIRPGVFVCLACAARERAKALGVPALRTRELGARHLVRAVVVALLVVLGTAQAEEPAPAPAESRYCARDGESIEQRIERLEVALRLAKAEKRVNDGRKRHEARR